MLNARTPHCDQSGPCAVTKEQITSAVTTAPSLIILVLYRMSCRRSCKVSPKAIPHLERQVIYAESLLGSAICVDCRGIDGLKLGVGVHLSLVIYSLVRRKQILPTHKSTTWVFWRLVLKIMDQGAGIDRSSEYEKRSRRCAKIVEGYKPGRCRMC